MKFIINELKMKPRGVVNYSAYFIFYFTFFYPFRDGFHPSN